MPLPEGVSGLLAVVEIDLRRDLSEGKVIRDERFEALLAAVRRSEATLRQRAPPAALIESTTAAPALLGGLRGAVAGAALLAVAMVGCGYLHGSMPWLAGALFLGLLIVVIRVLRGGHVEGFEHR